MLAFPACSNPKNIVATVIVIKYVCVYITKLNQLKQVITEEAFINLGDLPTSLSKLLPNINEGC